MKTVVGTKRWFTGFIAFLLGFMPILMVTTAISIAGLGSVVSAQATNANDETTDDNTISGGGGDAALGNVQTVACNAANIIRGPAGIAIGFLVVVGGIIALQVASRDALPLIGRGVFGTALLLGASAAFAAVISTPCEVTSNPSSPEIIVEAPQDFLREFNLSL